MGSGGEKLGKILKSFEKKNFQKKIITLLNADLQKN